MPEDEMIDLRSPAISVLAGVAGTLQALPLAILAFFAVALFG